MPVRLRSLRFFLIVIALWTMAGCQSRHTPDKAALDAYQKAVHLRQEGRLDSALVECQRAIALDSLIPRAYQLRAYLQYKSGASLELSIADEQRCLHLLNDSTDGSAHLEMAKYLHKAGRLHEAFAEYLATVQVDSTYADGHIELAHIYDFRHDTVNALTHYDRFLRYADPHDTLISFAQRRIFELNAPRLPH